MDAPPTFAQQDWRLLEHACRAVAAKERAKAEAISGRGARDYVSSAEEFERPAERCLRMARA